MFYGIHLVRCCTYWRGSSACSAEHSIFINDTYGVHMFKNKSGRCTFLIWYRTITFLRSIPPRGLDSTFPRRSWPRGRGWQGGRTTAPAGGAVQILLCTPTVSGCFFFVNYILIVDLPVFTIFLYRYLPYYQYLTVNIHTNMVYIRGAEPQHQRAALSRYCYVHRTTVSASCS